MKKKGGIPQERLNFWYSLLERANKKTDLHKNIKGKPKRNGIHAGIGKGAFSLGYCGRNDKMWVQFTINVKGHLEETKKIYNELLTVSESIDKKYPELKIIWTPTEKDPDKTRLVLSYSNKGGIGETDKWSEIQDDLIERMVKFEIIFKNWTRNYIG
jgi:hypothetical protein